jgi:hypothetical protein
LNYVVYSISLSRTSSQIFERLGTNSQSVSWSSPRTTSYISLFSFETCPIVFQQSSNVACSCHTFP